MFEMGWFGVSADGTQYGMAVTRFKDTHAFDTAYNVSDCNRLDTIKHLASQGITLARSYVTCRQLTEGE